MNILMIIILILICGLLAYLIRFVRYSTEEGKKIFDKLGGEIESLRQPEIREVDSEKLPEDYDYIKDLYEPLVNKVCGKCVVKEDKILFTHHGMNFVMVCPIAQRVRLHLPGIMEVEASNPVLPKIIEIGNMVSSAVWGVRFCWIRGVNEETGHMEYRFSYTADIYFEPGNPTGGEMMLESYFDSFREAMIGMQIRLKELHDTAEGSLPNSDWNVDDSIDGFSQSQMN